MVATGAAGEPSGCAPAVIGLRSIGLESASRERGARRPPLERQPARAAARHAGRMPVAHRHAGTPSVADMLSAEPS
ncbi:hypothetical protein EFP20_14530 [Burkholderia glumae]|nr:hypothetical protein EFP17_20625 [Burkholderia glumae]UVT02733.1 hypothetical protein EFP20_14530 [Burkholderia glumae]